MPNQTNKIDNAALMESYIRELIEFLNENEDWQYPTLYTILEYFPYSDKEIRNNEKDILEYVPNVFELYNLKMEIEDGIVLSEDAEDKLCEITTILPLLSFTVDSIIYMSFQETEKYVTISFSDGYIRIYY